MLYRLRKNSEYTDALPENFRDYFFFLFTPILQGKAGVFLVSSLPCTGTSARRRSYLLGRSNDADTDGLPGANAGLLVKIVAGHTPDKSMGDKDSITAATGA